MDPLLLSLDAPAAAGTLLGLTRAGAFVVASPMLSRSIGPPGRLAITLALGWFLSTPVSASLDVPSLVGLAVVNVVIGLVLGHLTGVLFHLFASAGSLVDLSSGLASASMIDPTTGDQAAIFSRLFNMIALTLFAVLGGMHLVVRGLAASVRAIPLDGSIAPHSDLITVSVGLVSDLLVAALQLALPLLAALFVAEVVLGLAARFAPQANVFMLGLPAKLLITLVLGSAAFVLFPGVVDGFLAATGDTFRDVLRGLTPRA